MTQNDTGLTQCFIAHNNIVFWEIQTPIARARICLFVCLFVFFFFFANMPRSLTDRSKSIIPCTYFPLLYFSC